MINSNFRSSREDELEKYWLGENDVPRERYLKTKTAIGLFGPSRSVVSLCTLWIIDCCP